MKVNIKKLSDKAIERRDYSEELTIKVNGKKIIDFYDGEPEDNTLARNFNDAYKIGGLIRMAYEAGLKNEGFFITEEIIE